MAARGEIEPSGVEPLHSGATVVPLHCGVEPLYSGATVVPLHCGVEPLLPG